VIYSLNDLALTNADNGSPVNKDGTEVFDFPVATGPTAGKPTQQPSAVPLSGSDSPTSFVEDPNSAGPSPDPQCAGPQYGLSLKMRR